MIRPARHDADERAITDLARELLQAESDRVPIAPVAERLAGSVAAAYAVQREGLRLRQQDNRRVVGHKVGLTSPAMQQQLGVDEPDFGYLLDDMVMACHETIAVSDLIDPKVEGEIAFLLAEPLHGPRIDRTDVLAATSAVAPALEVIDSRIARWEISIVDTVADNASCGRAVFGPWRSPRDVGELDAIEMVLTAGTQSVSGDGRAVLGHPANAIAWLARTLHGFGRHIDAQTIILPGSLGRAVPASAGMTATAAFAGLGEVEVVFA